MKISEIILDGKDDLESLRQYTNRLIKMKIKRLGRGVFASVWQHPYYSNVAVKVAMKDSGYLKYLKFIVDHPNNQYVPQIIPQDGLPYSKYRLSYSPDFDVPPVVYIIFMKKYDNVPLPTMKKHINNLFDNWSRYLGDWNLGVYRDKAALWRKLANNPQFQRDDPDGAELALFLSRQPGSALDLHSGNFRYDKENKQLIFTDPLAVI